MCTVSGSVGVMVVASKKAAPNRALHAVLAQAGLSNNRLARDVQAESRRRGAEVHTDHVTVKRWLDGQQPKADTAHFVATVLSRALNRAVTPAALGFTNAVSVEQDAATVQLAVEYLSDADTATDALRTLAGADTENTSLERLRSWDAHAAPGVISGYLFGDGQPEPLTVASGESPIDATSIRVTTANLMQLDFQLGGGHTRELLLYFFRAQVLPLFDSLPRGAPRRELFVATAELAQMLGWSAYDAGRHGAAQRYFVHALRLAREADDSLMGARLLSNLSHQANYLGDFTHAVQLARAAQSAAASRGPSSSTTLAMLTSMEARALASLGDRRGCASALSRAEALMDRSDSSTDPDWIGYFDRAELAGESAHCFRDLQRPEETKQFSALALPDGTPPRTRAFINMVTAMGSLHGGLLDEALETARTAVTLAGSLRSSRYRRYVRDFVAAAVQLHPRDPRVVDLVVFTAPVVDEQPTV
jgi:hypothetical protein